MSVNNSTNVPYHSDSRINMHPVQYTDPENVTAVTKALSIKTYGKCLGAFLSIIGYATKLKDKKGEDVYVNIKSLTKHTYRLMDAKERIKASEGPLSPEKFDKKVAKEMVSRYETLTERNYSQDLPIPFQLLVKLEDKEVIIQYKFPKAYIADILEHKKITNIEELTKNASDPRVLLAWSDEKAQQMRQLEEKLERAGLL